MVLSELLSPYADHLVILMTSGLNSVSHFLGMLATSLGQFEEAEARFNAAAATHARIGAPVGWPAPGWNGAACSSARHQPGDAERARDLLSQALATARELGLANVERRAVVLGREDP